MWKHNISGFVGELGEILVLDTFIGKEEMPQINDFSFHFKKQEKEGQVRTKVSRRKEIIKTKVGENQWNKKQKKHREKSIEPNDNF